MDNKAIIDEYAAELGKLLIIQSFVEFELRKYHARISLDHGEFNPEKTSFRPSLKDIIKSFNCPIKNIPIQKYKGKLDDFIKISQFRNALAHSYVDVNEMKLRHVPRPEVGGKLVSAADIRLLDGNLIAQIQFAQSEIQNIYSDILGAINST